MVTLPCQPFHGTMPGESRHSASCDSTGGLHPMHWGVHESLGEARRSIDVDVDVVESCP